MISKPPVTSLFVTGWFVASISVGQEAPKVEIPPAPVAGNTIEKEVDGIGTIASVYRGEAVSGSVPAGMGFFVDDRGTFVSVFGKNPGVSEKMSIGDGELFQDARLLAHDPKTGLVLLRVDESSGKHLELSHSEVREETELHLQGSRARFVGREISHLGQPFAVPLLHLKFEDSHILPGTPITDSSGRVVGILQCGAGGIDAGCFALPVDVLKKIQESFDQFGKIQAGWIGLIVDSQRSVPEVIELRDGSPARAAGVLPGDIVRKIGGRPIRDMKDMVDACYHLSPGESVDFVVLRGVEDVTLTMTPISASSEEAPPKTQEEMVEVPQAEVKENLVVPEAEVKEVKDSDKKVVIPPAPPVGASPDGGSVVELPAEEGNVGE